MNSTERIAAMAMTSLLIQSNSIDKCKKAAIAILSSDYSNQGGDNYFTGSSSGINIKFWRGCTCTDVEHEGYDMDRIEIAAVACQEILALKRNVYLAEQTAFKALCTSEIIKKVQQTRKEHNNDVEEKLEAARSIVNNVIEEKKSTSYSCFTTNSSFLQRKSNVIYTKSNISEVLQRNKTSSELQPDFDEEDQLFLIANAAVESATSILKYYQGDVKYAEEVSNAIFSAYLEEFLNNETNTEDERDYDKYYLSQTSQSLKDFIAAKASQLVLKVLLEYSDTIDNNNHEIEDRVLSFLTSSMYVDDEYEALNKPCNCLHVLEAISYNGIDEVDSNRGREKEEAEYDGYSTTSRSRSYATSQNKSYFSSTCETKSYSQYTGTNFSEKERDKLDDSYADCTETTYSSSSQDTDIEINDEIYKSEMDYDYNSHHCSKHSFIDTAAESFGTCGYFYSDDINDSTCVNRAQDDNNYSMKQQARSQKLNYSNKSMKSNTQHVQEFAKKSLTDHHSNHYHSAIEAIIDGSNQTILMIRPKPPDEGCGVDLVMDGNKQIIILASSQPFLVPQNGVSSLQKSKKVRGVGFRFPSRRGKILFKVFSNKCRSNEFEILQVSTLSKNSNSLSSDEIKTTDDRVSL